MRPPGALWFDGKVLLDLQQVLPLPEAADYQARLRRKEVARERTRSDGRDFTRFHIVVDGVERPHQNKRNAIKTMLEELAARGAQLAEIRTLLPERVMRVVPRRLGDAARWRRPSWLATPRWIRGAGTATIP